MKNISSRYFGKIKSIVKQDGFFAGVTAIAKAVGIIFYMPPRADVLFISSGAIGASWLYRVKYKAEELKINGISSSIVVQENFWLLNQVDRFQFFVFHRVSESAQIKKLIDKIKEQGKEIIFETDDLIFDLDLVEQQNFYKNANLETKEFYQRGTGREILLNPDVKVCTTATEFLAKKLREYEKKVYVLPNRLSKTDLRIADVVLAKQEKGTSDKIKIGYFSGTRSHDDDFATIVNALLVIMDKYSNVELCLAGPLDIQNKLNKFNNRIKLIPFAARKKHFENLSQIDINIVPLEIGNPFCEAKSELKFFEAGIVKVPTVAAATEPFRQAIEDGVDGFVANGTEEWIEKLSKLIEDKELRKAMGEKAREKALQKYTTTNANNEEYYNYLRKHLK